MSGPPPPPPPPMEDRPMRSRPPSLPTSEAGSEGAGSQQQRAAGRPPPPVENRPPGARRIHVPEHAPRPPGMRAPHALKAHKPVSTDQHGPPDLTPPRVFRPASDWARDMDITELETPRQEQPPPPPDDTEDVPEEEDEETKQAREAMEAASLAHTAEIEHARAKVPWIGSVHRHELGVEVIDRKGNVYSGKPPPPGRPPRLFRPTLR